MPLARDTSATAMTKDQTKKRAKNRAVSPLISLCWKLYRTFFYLKFDFMCFINEFAMVLADGFVKISLEQKGASKCNDRLVYFLMVLICMIAVDVIVQ